MRIHKLNERTRIRFSSPTYLSKTYSQLISICRRILVTKSEFSCSSFKVFVSGACFVFLVCMFV